MTDKDTIDMIQRCIEEITMLRNQIAVLRPKADAYDTVTQILGLLPRGEQGYGVDLVWQLRNQIKELQPQPAASENAR